jgi:endoglucanase
MAASYHSRMPTPLRFALTLFALSVTSLDACATTPASISAADPVTRNGLLRVEGNRIVGVHGQPVALAGVSLGWSQWEAAPFYNASAVTWLRDDWKATVVRAALGIHKTGYLTHPEENLARVATVVDAAIAAGLYVIIDWHDHHAHEHPELAAAFFSDMARRYGRQPNVLYEIYNEPLRDASWSRDVKPYTELVIAAIRAIDPDNLIIVGSPRWSQDVDLAAADPVRDVNLAYSLHFYAGTHKQSLRDKALVALDRGVALFVTEWGTCNADGDGPVDEAETRAWFAFMREHHLSHCNWGLFDKAEGSAIVRPGASPTGGWTDADLTPSGHFTRELILSWPR